VRRASEEGQDSAKLHVERGGDTETGAVCPTSADSPDPMDEHQVDKLLAAGGDADLATGAPLPHAGSDQRSSADARVSSAMADVGPEQQAAAELDALPAQDLGVDAQPGAQQASGAPPASAAGSTATASRTDAAQLPDEPHLRSGVQPGALLTATNLAKLGAQSQTAEGPGIRRIEGQLDSRGRCRIASIMSRTYSRS